MDSSEKSSVTIQREIDVDRQRIEARIGAIQERMSPGQLIDEVLAYAKGSDGGEYISNLGKALKANPLPVALMGVSLAWLIAKQGTVTPLTSSAIPYQDDPLYYVQGRVRRVGSAEEVDGTHYTYFTDDAGQRFKALTDDAGRRAGNFVDATGRAYRGFADATGAQISQITDEAGTLLDASTGWLSDTWQQVKNTAAGLAQKVGDTTSAMSGSASNLGTSIQDQTARLNDVILSQFRDQPLVGGALAFAVGAAIGAALPHTDKEDEMLGEAADRLKSQATSQASELVEQGKDIASDALDKAVSVAADVHDAAKDRIVANVDQFKDRTLNR